MRQALALKLTEEDLSALERFRDENKGRTRVYIRALCVRMCWKMKSVPNVVGMVASALGVHRNTVTNALRRYRKKGIEGLQDKPIPGKIPIADRAYLKLLEKVVQTDPQELGYAFTVWSLPRLSAHMEQLTGKKLSAGRLSAVLRKKGFSYNRPRHTLKGKRNEAEFRKMQKYLEREKKPDNASICQGKSPGRDVVCGRSGNPPEPAPDSNVDAAREPSANSDAGTEQEADGDRGNERIDRRFRIPIAAEKEQRWIPRLCTGSGG